MAHPMKFAKDYLDFDPAEAEARSGLPPAEELEDPSPAPSMDFSGQKSDLVCWVQVLMAQFALSEKDAILLAAQCWPKNDLPLLDTVVLDPVAIARQAGARWQDAKQPDLFYRPARPGEGDGVYMAQVTETGLSEWEYRSYYEPPSAVVI